VKLLIRKQDFQEKLLIGVRSLSFAGVWRETSDKQHAGV